LKNFYFFSLLELILFYYLDLNILKISFKPKEKRKEIKIKQGTKFLVFPIHEIGKKKNKIELDIKNNNL
tara:strand:+ start:349 stop:555 length:207 start_codon:yes stop_codon:yes gene_type:complete